MGASKPQPPNSASERFGHRLDSWKEIAAYLRRDERTVRRWEAEGLPVHRKVHKKQASVYAYIGEIDAWWNGGRQDMEETAEPDSFKHLNLSAVSERVATHRYPAVLWLSVLMGVAITGIVVAAVARLSSTSGSQLHSLVVLPFENLSGDPAQDYLADGMTDELITDLAGFKGLRVISRSSALAYRGTRKPLATIARELGVDGVLEGSLSLSGNRVRVRAQLVEAQTDQHRWAQTYESEITDIVELQSSIAKQVAEQVSLHVSPSEARGALKLRPRNAEAYEDYLKGWYFFDKRTAGAAALSVSYFRKSIAQDPKFPLAYAGLAEALQTLTAMDVAPMSQTQAEASQALRHALELDPELGEAHAALGLFEAQWNWNWAEAERQMKMGLQFSPGSAIVHNRYAVYLQAVGRADEGVAEAKRALELDPLSFFMNRELGRALYLARKYDEAIAQLDRAAELDPHASVVNNWLSWIAEKRGDQARAMQFALLNAPLDGWDAKGISLLRHAYENRDWKGFCETDLRRLTANKDQPSASYFIAVDELRLGNKEAAFNWLETSLEGKTVWVMWIGVDPLLDDLRSDPRFNQLLRKMRLPA